MSIELNDLKRLETSIRNTEASEILMGMYDCSCGFPHRDRNQSYTRGYSMQAQWDEIKTKQSEINDLGTYKAIPS